MSLKAWLTTNYRQEEELIKVPKHYTDKSKDGYRTYLTRCAKFAKKCGLRVTDFDVEKLSFMMLGSRWNFFKYYMGNKEEMIEPDYKEAFKFLKYDLF